MNPKLPVSTAICCPLLVSGDSTFRLLLGVGWGTFFVLVLPMEENWVLENTIEIVILISGEFQSDLLKVWFIGS